MSDAADLAWAGNFSDIQVSFPQARLMLITLNRPSVRNALRNHALLEIGMALDRAEADDSIRAVVLYGGPDCFAAGADLNEMAALDAVGAAIDQRPLYWRRIAAFSKPLLAAVTGYAFGAGCELVMHADIAIAGTSAKFGQPEINLGIIPGAGGTQRLIRAVGKPLAMKMVLGGEAVDAATALQAGLVSEVVDDASVLARTLAQASTIATKSPLALRLAKESILMAYEMPLSAGLIHERKAFSLLAASADRAEGIAAFRERRKPEFSGK